ncbi:transmembrane emp24 domain-containing protein 7-like [Babylonia areolata]|uniref:transmembrane emp24 domain-containing protein 7-like n=1 Tax=Babylonia areolata TaxID=304850 RepID=UPI003FD02F1C
MKSLGAAGSPWQLILLTTQCALWTGLLLTHVQHVAGHGSQQITYILPKRQMICFSDVWYDSDKIFFEYQVLRGGSKDVHVQIITPNGMVLYEKQWATKDVVTFAPQNGEFQFCFDNRYSMIYEKVVMFNIRSAFTKSLAQEVGDTEPTVQLSTHMSCDVIHEAVSAILDFQRRYRVRESVGRHLAEQLNKMVSWWSVVQSGVVLVCGLGQVLVLRCFFTQRRPSSKPGEGEPEEQQVTVYPQTPARPSAPENLFM